LGAGLQDGCPLGDTQLVGRHLLRGGAAIGAIVLAPALHGAGCKANFLTGQTQACTAVHGMVNPAHKLLPLWG